MFNPFYYDSSYYTNIKIFINMKIIKAIHVSIYNSRLKKKYVYFIMIK